MSKKPKIKSADSLDDIFLDALEEEIFEEGTAEEILSEKQLHEMEVFKEEGEPEIERYPEEPATPDEEILEGIKIIISDDRMSASLLAENCPPMELSALMEELHNSGVVYGIKEKVLENAVTAIQTGGGWKGELVVARGFEPALDDLISYEFISREKDPAGEEYLWMADGVPLFFQEIKELLSSKNLEDIDKSDLSVKAIAPYEVIATLKSETKNLQGYDIFGNPVGGTLTAPEAGDNVDFDEDDGTYTAEAFGYLFMDDKRISVLLPTWETQDQMDMYFVNFKQAGEFCYPFPENIQKMLIDKEVESFAVLVESIEKMSSCFADGTELPRTVKIAHGVDPIPGKNAKFEFHHDTEIKAGTLREDDSMDMRERNLVTSVVKDTLLGEKKKHTRGVSGKSIFGNEVKAPDGVDITIYINEGVYEKKKEDDIIEYYSAIDGNISYRNNYISVADVFGIEGDVDYSTGNIEVKTGITIGGSVCPGFSVKAGGNTIINGAVELGGNVFVDGDLCIQNGVIGEDTKVVVLGNLQVDFIQDADVAVKGDITVKSYIYNGRVRAGGEVVVKKEAGSKGGKIIGGFVCASKGIELSTVGSISVRNTLVSLQPDPVIQGKEKKLVKDVEYCDENIAKMLRTLQLKSFDSETIKAMVANAAPEQKEMIIKVLETLNKFVKHRDEVIEKKKQLQLYIEQCLKRAKIRISANFHEGNQVEIGDRKFVAQDDMGPSIFQLVEDRIVY